MTKAGIYIHIPFCRSRCSYCDFATGAFDERRARDYVAALRSEIEGFPRHQSFIESLSTVDTIYFGGGTPSLLDANQIAEVLDRLKRKFEVDRMSEITLEINPGTVDINKAKAFVDIGITRASFGAQTFNDTHLKQLGRAHDAREIRVTFDVLREAGFTNINFDLIAGLPAQTPADWHSNLRQAIALRPEHLSLYLLEVHPATPLAAQLTQQRFTLPDEDTTAAMYRLLIDEMTRAGYEHYEISNFCLPGFESRHNSKYWTGAPVYGFGCAAHSFDGVSTRWANTRDVLRYIELMEKGESGLDEVTNLTREDLRDERIFLGLRLMRGIAWREYQARFTDDLRDTHNDDLTRLVEAGLIEINSERLKLTGAGALLSNEVFARLV